VQEGEQGKGFSGLSSLVTDLSSESKKQLSEPQSVPASVPLSSSSSSVDEAAKRGLKNAKKRRAAASNKKLDHPLGWSKKANDRAGRWVLGILTVLCFFMFVGVYQSWEKQAPKQNDYSQSIPIKQSSAPPKEKGKLKSRPNRTVMYVTAETLNVRSGPSGKAEKLGKLKKYQTITVYGDDSQGNWASIRHNGKNAFVYNKYIKPGSGKTAFRSDCRAAGITRPRNNDTFDSELWGENALKVDNKFGTDALVKLKDHNDKAMVIAYVRGGQSISVNNIPSGSYQFQYATGKSYSPKCGFFLDDMQASKAPGFQDYKKTYSGNGYYTSIMSYTLYKVSGGNLQTRNMPADQF
jgi:hypothetical protein